MTLEVQSLVFPRARFTIEEAQGWASLHGFDHGEVGVCGDRGALSSWIWIDHRPRSAFDVATLHSIPLGDGADGVRAIVGQRTRSARPSSSRMTYLQTPEEREVYERFSELLRRRAILGTTRVAQGAESDRNVDLVAWYRAWFHRTHRGETDEELAVARAIAEGLGQATRDHALEYVQKLGWRRREWPPRF